MTDVQLGESVVKKFYSWNKTFYPQVFKLSYEEFLQALNSNPKKNQILFDGIGGGVREADISNSRIDTAMRKFALDSKGKIPAKPMDFFNYLSNEATKVNFVDAVVYTVKESVGDIASGAESLGNSLIFTGKILNFLLPAIVLVIVFFWVNSKTGNRLVK